MLEAMGTTKSDGENVEGRSVVRPTVVREELSEVWILTGGDVVSPGRTASVPAPTGSGQNGCCITGGGVSPCPRLKSADSWLRRVLVGLQQRLSEGSGRIVGVRYLTVSIMVCQIV